MDHFHKLKSQVRTFIFIVLALCTTVVVVGGWLARKAFPGSDTAVSGIMLAIGLGMCLVLSYLLSNYALKPLSLIWRAVLHVSPGHSAAPPPNLQEPGVGRELVTSLALQVYQLASNHNANATVEGDQISLLAQAVADNLPVPVYVMDANQTVIFANSQALHYLGLPATEVVGKNYYSVLDFSFPNGHTLDTWLAACRNSKVSAVSHWEHVRLKLPGDSPAQRQFDMAAAYSKDNSAGIETILTLFDQTAAYTADDQALSFVALAVHELRTPLTILRGYIEVFEDELGDKLDPELTGFMHKMHVSAQQLSVFVSNILNVARVEENQLVLQLGEASWNDIVKNAVSDFQLRAQVYGKSIDWSVDPGVPAVAVDKVSIYEVLNNLVDNAIKYSGNSKRITIRARVAEDGMIETTVTDAGMGIPTSVMPHLFEKFKRNHRTSEQVGGTGLGLYLCKAIVQAHGGNIWVTSKEGEGSTFGFTIQPYARLADELKTSNNKEIVRSAHGWIKNHSLYRR